MSIAGRLTESMVKHAKPGIHGDGAGLYLRVKPSGARSFVLRVQHGGRRQDIGLGGFPADLSLSEARRKAAYLRKAARGGKDAFYERNRLGMGLSDIQIMARTLTDLTARLQHIENSSVLERRVKSRSGRAHDAAGESVNITWRPIAEMPSDCRDGREIELCAPTPITGRWFVGDWIDGKPAAGRWISADGRAIHGVTHWADMGENI